MAPSVVEVAFRAMATDVPLSVDALTSYDVTSGIWIVSAHASWAPKARAAVTSMM
jgi:hypothetical protein